MKRLSYEKPKLINLNNKTAGQVSTMGVCYDGTWPGPAPDGTMYCTNGHYAGFKGVFDTYCKTGYDAGYTCEGGSGVFIPT